MNKLPAASVLLSIGLVAGCSGGPNNVAEVDCSKKNSPKSLGQIAYFGFLGHLRDDSAELSVSDGNKELVFRYNDGELEGDINSSLDQAGEVLASMPTATVYAGAPRLDGKGFNLGVTAITLLCHDADPLVVYKT